MENEKKQRNPVWIVIALVIGVPLLLWGAFYVFMIFAMSGTFYNSAGAVKELLAEDVPRLREDMQANPERFEEAVEVFSALGDRTREMGIASSSISRASAYDLLHPEDFERRSRGDYTLEEGDLEMSMSIDGGRVDWTLAIKNHEGLAPHEKYYMTEEQKAFLFEFFAAMDQHNIRSLDPDTLRISLQYFSRTGLLLVYLPSEEEKAAFEEFSLFTQEYCEAILPGWYAYIDTMPFA